ncbi:MAG: phospholipase D-like domain-containing protein [Candidatus Thorarchaeota archaeon]
MRDRTEANKLTLKVYAGTTGVLLAMNIDDSIREDFLGFAIKRTSYKRNGQAVEKWLQGLLRFPGTKGKKLTPINTNEAPIQKFRWSDYCVYPDSDYIYELHRVSGDYKNPTVTPGPSVKIHTESMNGPHHQVVFNRAVAASQAYQRRFAGINPQDPYLHPTFKKVAMIWLARGVDMKMKEFINRAKDDKWALDFAAFQIELDWVADELKKARDRGVDLRILYHATKNRNTQTQKNELCLKDFDDTIKQPRITYNLFHQKIIVLSKKEGDPPKNQPVAVLTGSTNFTHNGVYRQANVVHVINDKTLAREYHNYFNDMWGVYRTEVGKVRNHIEDTDAIVQLNNPPEYQVVFSPRKTAGDRSEVIRIIKQAKKNVISCTAYDLHPTILEALTPSGNDKVIRYGLQDKESDITGVHRRGTFVTPAYLEEGFESFVKESFAKQKGNIYIHLKTILCDFNTRDPWIITGSNNFSNASSEDNDENMIIIRGDTNVADIYLCEMMRLYDHYRFRWNRKRRLLVTTHGRLKLHKSSKWTNDYFDDEKLEYHERMQFSAKD